MTNSGYVNKLREAASALRYYEDPVPSMLMLTEWLENAATAAESGSPEDVTALVWARAALGEHLNQEGRVVTEPELGHVMRVSLCGDVRTKNPDA